MSLQTGPSIEPAAPQAFPRARSPGPFPVGRYAAALREQAALDARACSCSASWSTCARARARVYFELRDAGGRDPVRGLAERVGEDAPRRAGRRRREGMQVVVAGGCDYYPGSATAPRRASPSAVTDLRIAGEGDLLAQIDRLRKQLDGEGLLERQQRLPAAGAAARRSA